MRRLILGFIALVLLIIAVAHVTGTFTYSRYPAEFAKLKPEPAPHEASPVEPPHVKPGTPTKGDSLVIETTPPPVHVSDDRPDVPVRELTTDTTAAPTTKLPPPIVPPTPPPENYAPLRENYYVHAKNTQYQPIGKFPAGAVMTIRAQGTVRYGSRHHVTIGPIGNPNFVPLPVEPDRGRFADNILHGALCLIVPPNPAIKGKPPHVALTPLPWKELGGGVWQAVYQVPWKTELSLFVADNKSRDYANNSGQYEVTVEWDGGGQAKK